MRLGNHHEAEQAAAFIGRHHKFTVSGWTATQGGEHGATRTSGRSHGTSQSRGSSATSGWSGDGPWGADSGSRTRSSDRGRSQDWSESEAVSDGESWSSAQSIQRVYEYAVEPTVLQNLPGNALLLPQRGTAGRELLAVECDPRIITLPGAAPSLAAVGDHSSTNPVAEPGGRPALDAPRRDPASQLWRSSPADSLPARPRPAPPRWSRPGD
jgi:hypothetical protein